MFRFFTDKPGDGGPLTDTEFIEREIQRFKASRRRQGMLDGERYYAGRQDILRRQRMMIGRNGGMEPVENLPNNRVVDNQYRKMVDQKVNYLLGRPVVFRSDNAEYMAALGGIFRKSFFRALKNVCQDTLNCGIGWLFVHYDQAGALCFQRISPTEIIPGWRDAAHTVLDYAIRVYALPAYEGKRERVLEKVELYTPAGMRRFALEEGRLIPEEDGFSPYLYGGETPMRWDKIPLVAFRRDREETPLLRNIRCLQDGLNLMLSNFQNCMEEDARNTILVLQNYDGEDLGEFRHNLMTYGVVKVRTVDGESGDLRSLRVEVRAENYQAIIRLFKKAIIENAMGYDAKDERLGGNPNQMNIQSMYSDIDLDANAMETEYQAAMEQLLWFVNAHLANTGAGDFAGEDLEIIFNRDMLISEADIIQNVQRSEGIISKETLVANHPWVNDVGRELQRLGAVPRGKKKAGG